MTFLKELKELNFGHQVTLLLVSIVVCITIGYSVNVIFGGLNNPVDTATKAPICKCDKDDGLPDGKSVGQKEERGVPPSGDILCGPQRTFGIF